MDKIVPVLLKVTAKQAQYLAENPDSLKALVRAVDGTIKCHIDIASIGTSAVNTLANGGVLNWMCSGVNATTGIISLASNVAQNVQLHKLQKTSEKIVREVEEMSRNISAMGRKVDGIASLSWLNAGLSVVNIGATVISTVYLSNKIDKISAEVSKNTEMLKSIKDDLFKLNLKSDLGIIENYFRDDLSLNEIIKNYVDEIYNGKTNYYSMSETENYIDNVIASIKTIHQLVVKNLLPIDIGLNMIVNASSKVSMLIKLYSTKYYYEKNCLPVNIKQWTNIIETMAEGRIKDYIFDYYLYNVPVHLTEIEVRNIISTFESYYCKELSNDIIENTKVLELFNKEQYLDLVTVQIPNISDRLLKEIGI